MKQPDPLYIRPDADTHKYRMIRAAWIMTALFFIALFVNAILDDFQSKWAPILLLIAVFCFFGALVYHKLATSRLYFKITDKGIITVVNTVGKPKVIAWGRINRLGIVKGILAYTYPEGREEQIVLSEHYSRSQIVHMKLELAKYIRKNKIMIETKL